MTSILIKNGLLINENEKFIADIFIEDDLITEISKNGINRKASKVIEAEGKWVMPGIIDDQVHLCQYHLLRLNKISLFYSALYFFYSFLQLF